MSEFYRRPETAEESPRQDQEREPTPAETFGREADTVAVSRSTPRGRGHGYGEDPYRSYGYGGQHPTTDIEHFEVKYPRQAIELDRDTRIIATAYNTRRDA